MAPKRKDLCISIITKIILVVISVLSWNSFLEFNIFLKIILRFVFPFLVIYDLLKPVKNHIIFKQIYLLFEHIYNIIFKLVVVLKIITEPFFVFILMFSVQFILLRLFFLIFNYNIGPEITYVISLITVVLFAYKGVYLIHFFQRWILKNEGKIDTIVNKLIVEMVSIINFRRRIYEIMILMYILSSIEKLSVNFNIYNIYWKNYSKISLEILLTFVAIDGYVNTFMTKVIKKEREQYREIKQYYF